MEYSLKEHGDAAEKKGCLVIQKDFPNYERFWAKFIIPMSRRPIDVQFRRNIDFDLQRVAMSHYTIFRNLLFVNEVIYSHRTMGMVLPFTFNERIDNVYIYLASIVDMVENIFWTVNVLRFKLGIISENPFKESNLESMNEITEKYFTSSYKRDFEQFCKKRKSVNVMIHNSSDSLNLVKEDPRRRFLAFSNDIRAYRNAVVHNPQMGTVYISGIAFIPKNREALNKYYYWERLINAGDPNDFEQAETVIEKHFKLMQSMLNEVWESLIELFEEISNTVRYAALLGEEDPTIRTSPMSSIIAIKNSTHSTIKADYGESSCSARPSVENGTS